MIPGSTNNKSKSQSHYSLNDTNTSTNTSSNTNTNINLNPTPPQTPSFPPKFQQNTKLLSPPPDLPPSIYQVVDFLTRYLSDDSSVSGQEFKIFDNITTEDYTICSRLLKNFIVEEEEEEENIETGEVLDKIQLFIESWSSITPQHFRVEYFPKSSQLVFRMPCIIHEETIFLTGEYITETFKSGIEKVPDDFSFKLQLLDGINRKMSWPVPYSYNGKDRKLYPDIAFPFYLPKGHRNNPEKGSKSLLCKYPGLVMEVGYSQTLESLRNYVKYYLLRMEFGVNKVILVKIDPKTKRSTLECWERCKKNINGTEYWCVQMCRVYRSKSVMEIRGLDGAEGAQIDAVLRFRLGDLVSSSWYEKYPQLLSTTVRLPVRPLFGYINQAIDHQEETNEGSGSVPPATPTPVWEGDDDGERSMSASFTEKGTMITQATTSSFSKSVPPKSVSPKSVSPNQGGTDESSDMEEREILPPHPDRIPVAVSPKGRPSIAAVSPKGKGVLEKSPATSSTETPLPNRSKRSNTNISGVIDTEPPRKTRKKRRISS